MEVFARNNNLRTGWFSLGNQLGEAYDKWFLTVSCNACGIQLKSGLTRYKAKYLINYDLCGECIQKHDVEDFFELENKADEDILHFYQKCNRC